MPHDSTRKVSMQLLTCDETTMRRIENHWGATISRRRRYESYNTTREEEMAGTDRVKRKKKSKGKGRRRRRDAAHSL